MATKTNSAFIDTNIIQKIGGYRGEELLSKILYSFGYNLYIHEYLIKEELIFGESSLKQLNEMIDKQEIIIMKVSDLIISDDQGAKVAAKRRLQKLDGSSLETIRMRDVILQIRNNQEYLKIERKTAKNLYLYDVNPKLARNPSEEKRILEIRDYRKKEFDEKLWPLE